MRSFVDLFKILEELDGRIDWPAFFEDREREGLDAICSAVAHLFLGTFAASDWFRNLAVWLETREGAPEIKGAKPRFLDSSTFGFRNKRWAFSLYPTSRAEVYGWWLLSLPFRLAVYRFDGPRKALRSLGRRLMRRGARVRTLLGVLVACRRRTWLP